jgi:hypothetical protein
MGFDLSRATCGRILAQVREVYGYEKPESGGGALRAMPFAASERHEVWSADVRHLDMIDEGLVDGRAYAVTVMDNNSRAILSSAVTRRQDLSAFLSVFYRAVDRHGAPKTLLTDSGSVFLANRARAVYAKLGISKEEIEKGRPWQNYSESTFGIQKGMADWHFQRAGSWVELVGAHDRFVSDYNAQPHFAHQRRGDGRSSPGKRAGANPCREGLSLAQSPQHPTELAARLLWPDATHRPPTQCFARTATQASARGRSRRRAVARRRGGAGELGQAVQVLALPDRLIVHVEDRAGGARLTAASAAAAKSSTCTSGRKASPSPGTVSSPSRSRATVASWAVPGPTSVPPLRMVQRSRSGSTERTCASMARTGATTSALSGEASRGSSSSIHRSPASG